MSEPVYVATVNVPGYSPECEPVTFDTANEAWLYLASERRRDEDQDESTSEYSDYVTGMEHIGSGEHEHGSWAEDWWTNADGTGVIYADTPGSDSPHDLGLAYVVSLVPHADYPHEPGRLHDCAACEARCHCTPGTSQCVYGGEHDV